MVSSWSLPEKVEDLYPKQALKLENYRRQIIDLFLKQKFNLIQPALIEFSDNISFNGQNLNDDTFKVSDPLSKELIGITPDLTIQTARIDNYLAKGLGDEMRYCYAGPVLKTNANQLGKSREEFQVGVEIYGNSKADADNEVILLLTKVMKLLKIKKPLISFNDLYFFYKLTEKLNLNSMQLQDLRKLIAMKNKSGIQILLNKICSKSELSKVLKFVDINGSGNAIKDLSSLFADKESKERVKNLQKIANKTAKEINVFYDFSDVDYYEYHNGLVFSVYAEGFGSSIAAGGRFDSLTRNFGKKRAAVGFSFDLRNLLFN
jgi:ATP phosphoribosyltransferase regulatory subunit